MRCLIEKSVKSAVKRSAAVFSGEVLEIKNGRNFMEARFRVERSWKGVDAEEEVTVLVGSTVESPHYRVGERYLVFAGLQYGKLFTGNCSGRKRLRMHKEICSNWEKEKSPKRSRVDFHLPYKSKLVRLDRLGNVT